MKKRPRDPKPLPPALISATGPALIKFLASCNTTVRSQSLRLLQSWLATQSQHLSDSEVKKLWKGLFYCVWHADRTSNQVALIDRLTSMFVSMQPSISLAFFRGFLVTLRREWPGIDKLRLDKFYLLIRRFVRALFEVMRLRKWDVEVLGEYFRVLECDGFLAEDKLRGSGVNYHIVSVFLEELKGVGFPVRKEVVDVILRPFFTVIMSSGDRILLAKVKSCVFDELVKVGKVMLEKKRMGEVYDENDGDLLLGVVSLRMGLSRRFYQVGSSIECNQGNRKMALELHEEFLKLEKELELSGIEIAVPEYSYAVSGDDYDEVPLLIPIDSCIGIVEANTRENSDKGISKKIKKAKSKNKKNKKKRDKSGVSEITSVVEENGDLVKANKSAENFQPLSDDVDSDGNLVVLSKTMILNLQKQFENVVAEASSESDEDLDFSNARKRKRTKESANMNIDSGVDVVAKSVKKVRFCMKNNLVWKPHNPLPPQSLRLPPSVTPRGSALKKGVRPGPVVEMVVVEEKAKLKKKAQNRLKSVKAVVKRLKKVRT